MTKRQGMTVMRSSAIALAIAVCAPAHAADLVNITEQVHGGELVVPLNKSQVLKVEKPFAQVLVGNPEIADILPLTDRSVYVLGKKMGSTSLTVYDRAKNLIAVVDLVVGPDVLGLKRQLYELMPAEQIGVRVSNDTLVLTGNVSAGPAAERAVQLANTYAPDKVVNLMGVGASQQVLLEVRFSEMTRQTAKQIGVNSAFTDNDGDFSGGFGNNAVDSLISTSPGGGPVVDLTSVTDTFGTLATFFRIGDVNIGAVLDALERKGLVSTLAEPNLVAMSGDTASFLAGGEFPIPVNQRGGNSDNSGNSITVEFKEFGVGLSFTPTVLADGVINLEVAPEVSSIDPTASINLNGLVIPGLKTRRAKTTLELRDGESFAIAGLIRSDFEDTVRQFPLLGSIPIIGSLFRSSGFRREETELVITVTPHLVRPVKPEQLRYPTDRVLPASEGDLFLLGRASSVEGQTFPQGAAQPGRVLDTAGGIDGDHGHIVR